MTSKRQALLDRVSSLPEEVLDELSSSLDDIEALHAAGLYRLSKDERAAVQRGIDAAKRGDIASDLDVARFIRRHSV